MLGMRIKMVLWVCELPGHRTHHTRLRILRLSVCNALYNIGDATNYRHNHHLHG